jgi:hypothetical protein
MPGFESYQHDEVLADLLKTASSKIGPVYHGTDREFTEPRPLTHFGTLEAAKSAPHQGQIMEFYLSIQHPFETVDSPGGGDLWEWLNDAKEKGVISEEEFLEWEESPTGENFIRLLEEKGYDGIVYKNNYEDAGSTSWVIFYPEQAQRTK